MDKRGQVSSAVHFSQLSSRRECSHIYLVSLPMAVSFSGTLALSLSLPSLTYPFSLFWDLLANSHVYCGSIVLFSLSAYVNFENSRLKDDQYLDHVTAPKVSTNHYSSQSLSLLSVKNICDKNKILPIGTTGLKDKITTCTTIVTIIFVHISRTIHLPCEIAYDNGDIYEIRDFSRAFPSRWNTTFTRLWHKRNELSLG